MSKNFNATTQTQTRFPWLMLGTNDVKAQFGVTAEAVTGGIAGLIDSGLSRLEIHG